MTHANTLPARLRKLADDLGMPLLEDAAAEIDMLQSMCDTYSDNIATTQLYIDALREQVGAL